MLLEAAAFWPSCKFLGLELDQQQLASRLRRIGYGYWSRHPILNSLSVYVCIIYVACPCIIPQNITNEVWTKNFQVTQIYTSRQSAVTEEAGGCLMTSSCLDMLGSPRTCVFPSNFESHFSWQPHSVPLECSFADGMVWSE